MEIPAGTHNPEEDGLLRSVASQNAQSILAARQRAEQEVLRANEALERKTRELAESLALMRATLEATWDGILVTDRDGNITDFNRKFVDMWRIPPEIVKEARRHGDLVDFFAGQFAENDRAGYRTRIEAIYAASPDDSLDVLELGDGRVFERYCRVQSVDGRNAGRVWSFRDITRQRRSEEALRDETRTLELLNKAGTTLASKLDLQALLQAVTDAATELSGARFGAFFYNATDAKGDAFMLYTLSGAPREAFERFGQPRATPLFGPTFRGEGPIRCDDVLKDPRYGRMPPHTGMPPGHLPVRSYLAVPVISRSGEVIGGLLFGHPETGIFTDRAERLVVGIAAHAAVAVDNALLYEARKELLESERSARSEAERASAMKDDFLATVSHELRTPLNAILGWVRILRSRPPAADPDLNHALEVMERNASIQVQLIEDLLDMSRITSGKMRLDVQPLDPAGFIEAAIQTVTPAADAKGIRLRKLLEPTAGPITGDPNRLQQVVWNLLSNAIKFTGRNGRVEVVLRRAGSQIEILVADTGVGIKPETLPLIFERFQQGDSSRTRAVGGLGLGLSIVKHLVEQHGGTVSVASPGEGQGASFTVRLPLTVSHEGGGPSRHVGQTAAADYRFSDLSGIKVLVVDDQADARDLIRRVLTECGADVATAASVDEALAAITETGPDVLVSDIGMPDVDGYELLRRVRALGPASGGGVPAIALTAFSRSDDRTRALRAGFLAHVSKPVEPSELVATVASVVGRTGNQAS
jgi:signal transduction histidine kinase/PAS domain-containing protein/ActR/RegA family two-component response regulator